MRDRLAAESPEGRDSRLQNMSILQQAVETFEEREVRVQRATGPGCANREQSLFKQHFVQANFLQYHFYKLHMHQVVCTTKTILAQARPK